MRIEHQHITITMSVKEFKACHSELVALLNSTAVDAKRRLEFLEHELSQRLPEATLQLIKAHESFATFQPMSRETTELINEFTRLQELVS